MKSIPVAFAVVCACLLFGCAGGGDMVSQIPSGSPAANEITADTSVDTPPAGGCGLPSPSQIKAPSYIEEDLFRIGSDDVDVLTPQRAEPSGDSMVFTPGWDKNAPDNTGLAYTSYQFLLEGYDRDESARFEWSASDEFSDGWVALANWQRDAWNWYRLPAGDILALEFDGCIRTEDNTMLIVVLFTGQGSWTLDSLRIGAPPGAPQPPTNVLASEGDYLEKVIVTWDAPFGATGYFLYRDSQDLPLAVLGDVTTYEDYPNDVMSHYYRVIATNEFGPSGFSDRAEGYCATCLPPTDVAASDALYIDRIEVTWTKTPSASGYRVFRDTWKVPVATLGDVESWSDFAVADSGSHSYAVQGYNIIGYSKLSPRDPGSIGSPTPPAPPTNLAASDGAYVDHIKLTWTKADDTLGYEIYRDLQALPLTTVGDVDTWSDYSVIDNETHTYWLKSYNASGPSGFSDSDTGHLSACDAPTDVEASDGTYTDKIVVTWTKVGEAIGYKVFRDNKFAPIATLGDVSTFDDITIVNSGPHTYWLKAYTATGDSAFSAPDSGYMRALAFPSIPQNVQASDGTYTDQVEITWEAVEDAQTYFIYRDLQTAPIGNVNGELTVYHDRGLANYSNHEYWVKAWNTMGESDFSESDLGYMGEPDDPPEPPTNLQASDGEFNDKIRLTWDASLGATGYKIYRDSQAAPIDTVENVTSYDDISVTDYLEHTYWLKAVNVAGDSDFSESDTGFRTAEGTIPEPPTNLQASDGLYTTRIELTWNKSPGATGYNIYRDSQASPIASVGDVDTWDDTGVSDTDVHTYWLRATNLLGWSGFSESDTGYLKIT